MKKRNTLKLLITIVLAGSLFSSLYSQAPQWTQMQEEPTTVDTVTAGVPIPYFVMPDPVLNDQFNTNYDTSVTKAAQDIESSWNWFLNGAATGVGSSITKEGGAGESDGPYVEVTWVVNGGNEDTIYTSETAGPPASCPGDTNFVRTVVLAAPEMHVRDDAADDTVYWCDGISLQNVTLDEIIDNGVDGGNMNIRFDMQVDSLQSDLSGVLGNISLLTHTDTIVQIAQTSGADVTLMSLDFQAINGNITEYNFNFGSGNDGINDHISRKSDFLSLTDKTGGTSSEYTYYAPASTVSDRIVVRVFPAPSTGSIYYIPNDFNK